MRRMLVHPGLVLGLLVISAADLGSGIQVGRPGQTAVDRPRRAEDGQRGCERSRQRRHLHRGPLLSRSAAPHHLRKVLRACAARHPIGEAEYRDVYIELNGASTAGTKIFIEDLGADGLKARREDSQPPDNFEAAGKRVAFDGDWRKQQLSEQDYQKAFAAADAQYAQLLTALLAQLK